MTPGAEGGFIWLTISVGVDAWAFLSSIRMQILRQAAMQEFKLGSPERGRSIFENLLRNYHKRMDLWSIYIDQVHILPSDVYFSSPFGR